MASAPDVQARDRILLVDDEVEVLRVVRRLLERALPVEVIEATSGEAALALLRDHPVDLIISDQRMPGMLGTEFLARALILAPGAPRALLTARQEVDLAIEAVNELHISAFYPKPLDTASFLASVETLLAKRRAQRLREGSFDQASRVLREESTPPREGADP